MARLLERVGDLDDVDRPRPLVTLEEFFDGNDDPGSIGYNLSADNVPEQLYAVARDILGRPEVHAVLVEVKDWENEPGWPSADTLHVITTADPDTLQSWFPDELAPDECGETEQLAPPDTEAFPVPAGCRAVFCFYD